MFESDLDGHRLGMLEHRIARLERSLQMQLALARTSTVVTDTGPVQTVQAKIDPASIRDGIPVLFNYGYSSSVPVGGDMAMVFLRGDRSQGMAIASAHQGYRHKGLNPGEVVLYDMWGHSLLLTATGAVLNADLTVNGHVTASGAITAGFGGSDQVGLQSHRHAEEGEAPTNAPVAGT